METQADMSRSEIEAEAKRLGEEYAKLREQARALRQQIGPYIVALAMDGVSQADIAELTSLTRVSVQRYERQGGIVRQQRPWTATVTGADGFEPVTAITIEADS